MVRITFACILQLSKIIILSSNLIIYDFDNILQVKLLWLKELTPTIWISIRLDTELNTKYWQNSDKGNLDSSIHIFLWKLHLSLIASFRPQN